jgi:hypothetical protein
MMAVLLAAALAAQQPDLRDAGAVTSLLTSLRTADPAVCEMAGRTLANQWGWGSYGDLAAEPMPAPMPMPMPVPRCRCRGGPGFGPISYRGGQLPAGSPF